ncbi:MAG: IPExxxVDY family protein [Crocinitomicaceae bacterium]|nr:IPExxxVDY family protein [Crocinitomicaceae bacterium]
MAKRKKHILTFDEELDFEMIGLSSHHNDYRLAWSINDKVQLHLIKCDEDYIVTNKKGDEVSTHSMYAFEDEVNRLEYYLIKNKHKGQYLIHEKPAIDYFLFLCNNMAVDSEELIMNLKSVPSILAVFAFDPEEIPSAEQLVFS